MAFTGDEGGPIDAATAQRWIENYQKDAGPGAVKAEFFGFRRLSELIAQKDAVGLRMYYAKDDTGSSKLILVAANSVEKNLGPIDGSKTDGMLLDYGRPCPPYCGGD